MKCAFLLCGELRTFDNDYVIRGFDKLREIYDVDFYISAWEHRGRSEWSVRNNLNDGINANEIIKEDYVKKIFKTDKVRLFDYNKWVESTEQRTFYHFRNEMIQYNATFGLSFLRQECIKLLTKDYDVLVVSRPDAIFTKEPPSYFFDMGNKIWHQNYNFNKIIYSTFFTSTQKNISDICNWYDNDFAINETLSKIEKFEHCHILYKYAHEVLGIEIDTYVGSLFCEPFRTEEYVNFEKISDAIENKRDLGMDFDKKWFPFYEN